MRELDIRLLKVFEAIYTTGRVTAAAEQVGLSQPSISIALGRLRSYFKDPLFVRVSTGMAPTPLADRLVQPVRETLKLWDTALHIKVVFDARESDRVFRVSMTDISQIVLLPALINRLEVIAPSIRIDVVHISDTTPKMLEGGDVDLAIGFMPQLETGYFQQNLFRQSFVCLVRTDHPRVGARLSLQQFQREAHIQVVTTGTGHAIVEKLLERGKIKRRIALRIPSFLGLGSIVANTDLVATAPQRLGELLVERHKLRLLLPPMKLPSYAVKQHWHERYHHDPANQWLRGVVAELFLE
jgi:DNA-binding transcriptional LysR family regulator